MAFQRPMITRRSFLTTIVGGSALAAFGAMGTSAKQNVIRPENFSRLATDTLRIQAAMDAAGGLASANGSCSLMLEGMYVISSEITGRDGVQVLGTGTITQTGPAHAFNFSGRSGWSVRGISFLGNPRLDSDRKAPRAAVYGRRVTDVVVSNIKVEQWPNYAIRFENSSGVTIEGCRCRNNKGWFPKMTHTAVTGKLAGPYAAHDEDYSGVLGTTSKILVNGIRVPRAFYIIDNAAKTITFVKKIPMNGDVVEIVPYYNGVEIACYDSQRIHISRNALLGDATQPKSNAIEIHGSMKPGGIVKTARVRGNHISDYWGNGIGAGDEDFIPDNLSAMTSDVRVENNTIVRCGSYGIKFKHGSDMHASGNSIVDAELFGGEVRESGLEGAMLMVRPLASSFRNNKLRVTKGNHNANEGIRIVSGDAGRYKMPQPGGWTIAGNELTGYPGVAIRNISCRDGTFAGNRANSCRGLFRIDAGSSRAERGRPRHIICRGNRGESLAGTAIYVDRADYITFDDELSGMAGFGFVATNATHLKVGGRFVDANKSGAAQSVIRISSTADSEISAAVVETNPVATKRPALSFGPGNSNIVIDGCIPAEATRCQAALPRR